METFNSNSGIVLHCLSESLEGQATYSQARSCFRRFGAYLKTNNLCYSVSCAQEWLKQQEKSKSILQIYAKALRQLDDVYQAGHVSFFNRPHSAMILSSAFDGMISGFLSEVSSSYTGSHLKNILKRCRFFFGFLQTDRFCDTPEAITYDDILAFYDVASAHLCDADLCMYKGTVMRLLSWMSRKKVCSAGFSMLLVMDRAKKAVMLQDFPQDKRIQIHDIGTACYRDFPPEEFYEASLEFCSDLKAHGYASAMRNSARATFDLLFLFLDMNRLGYDPVVARGWFEHAGHSCFGSNLKMSRRLLSLFEVFTEEGAVLPEKTFVYVPLLCDRLPDWCREAIDRFLEQKRKLLKATSTIYMYRSSVTRFCMFLVSEGISSFAQVNAGLLKKFNLTDPHKTAEGKNAYNVRIRNFLFFLAQNGYIGNPCLGWALPCAAAPKTRIVEVLSEEECLVLENYCENDRTLGLRNRAILLLGLKMGLRGVDITSLRLEQIDWHSQSIRFYQQKTGVWKLLPFPADVGNALYRYLTEGRPENTSPYVFIKHKAPYGKIGRDVCGLIMKKAFPEKGSTGFHITRKTYATDRFRNNCGFTEVAGLLGHTSIDTVHRYISLDEERMRYCPVSLSAAGILMERGFRNE